MSPSASRFPKPIPGPGQRVLEAITREQVALLLNILLEDCDPQHWLPRLEARDSDCAQAIRAVLWPNPEAPKRTASSARLLEQWDDLWSQWEQVVSKLGDEKGDFALQEESWEPPWFDASSLSDALDKVALAMEPLIEEVFPVVDDPDLFLLALNELREGIQSFPEWMSGLDEPIYLGRALTECFLRWAWLTAQGSDRRMAEFVVRVERLDPALQLAESASTPFLAHLAEISEKELYEALRDAFGGIPRAHSLWRQSYLQLEERLAPAQWLSHCRQLIQEDWRHGMPAVDDAIHREDWLDAESLLEAMAKVLQCTAYRSGSIDATGRPETQLFVHGFSSSRLRGEAKLGSMLERWIQVATALGQHPRAEALEFQRVVWEKGEILEDVVAAYRRLDTLAAGSSLSTLYSQWQDDLARERMPQCGLSEGGTWVHWLALELVGGADGRKRLKGRLEGWLGELRRPGQLESRWQELAALTKDLPGMAQMKNQLPHFVEHVLEAQNGSEPIGASIRRALEALGGAELLPNVLEFWRQEMGRLVPDPSRVTGSNYTEHARWFMAYEEVNPLEASKLLKRWQVEHRRRLNLWKALAGWKIRG